MRPHRLLAVEDTRHVGRFTGVGRPSVYFKSS